MKLILSAALTVVALFSLNNTQAANVHVYQNYADTTTLVAKVKASSYTSCESTSKELTEKFEEQGYETTEYWFATRGKDRKIFHQKEMKLFNSKIIFKCYN